jgi:hypothetical protein
MDSKMEFDIAVLKQAADKACEMAYEDRRLIAGPVNWGDLGCTMAERYEYHTGRIGYRVLIEEAAPEAQGLQEYIAWKLDEMGCPGIVVLTEW